jgi:hypothetical protein
VTVIVPSDSDKNEPVAATAGELVTASAGAMPTARAERASAQTPANRAIRGILDICILNERRIWSRLPYFANVDKYYSASGSEPNLALE